MKYFLFSVLLLPAVAFGQDCKIKKDVDPYTKEVKFSTGFVDLGGTSLSIDATKTEVEFIFSVNGGQEGKCFDDKSTAVMNYEGGRLKGNFKNNSSMNCEGLFSITFRNVPTTPSNLKNLSVKKVLSIKLTNGKEVTEISLDEAEQALLIRLTGCLIEQSKTLLK